MRRQHKISLAVLIEIPAAERGNDGIGGAGTMELAEPG